MGAPDRHFEDNLSNSTDGLKLSLKWDDILTMPPSDQRDLKRAFRYDRRERHGLERSFGQDRRWGGSWGTLRSSHFFTKLALADGITVLAVAICLLILGRFLAEGVILLLVGLLVLGTGIWGLWQHSRHR